MKLPSIQTNMPESDYHGMTDFLSNSMLSEFIKSPAHLQTYLKTPREKTKAMVTGSLIHAAVLEPHRLESWAVLPECDRRTKEGKALYEAFLSSNQNRLIVTAEDYATAKGAVDAIWNHEEASKRLAGAETEVSCFFELDGVKCRSRLDAYKDGWLIDVKSTDDARPQAFGRSVHSWGYHRQLAFYSMAAEAVGKPVEKRILIAVEKSAPFGVMVYELDPNSYWKGQDEVLRAVKDYKKCLETNEWAGYPEEIQLIGLPAYAF